MLTSIFRNDFKLMIISTDVFANSDDLRVLNVTVIPEVSKKVVTWDYIAQMNFVVNGLNMSNFNNLTAKGGAIQMENNGWVRPYFAVQNSSFFSCRSTQAGGSVYMNDADTMEMSDSYFYNSTAFNSNGSVGAFDNSREVIIRNVTVDWCSGQKGALYFNNITQRTLLDSVIIRNTWANDGVGVYQTESAKNLFINNSAFFNLTATNGKGGVIYSNSNISTNLDNVEINQCKSQNNGGSLFIESFGNSSITNTIVNGSVTTNGGGGFINIIGKGNTETLKMDNVSLNYVESYQNGGCVSSTSMKNIDINNVNVNNAIARSGQGGFGSFSSGGAGSFLLINNSNFVNTTSISHGGLLYIDSFFNVKIEKSNVERTTSNSGGGGCFYVSSISGTFEILDSNFISCYAKSSYGGVLYASSSITNLLINFVQFYNCSSSYQGTICCDSITSQGKIMNTCAFQCSSATTATSQFISLQTSSGSFRFEMVSMVEIGKKGTANEKMVSLSYGFQYFYSCNASNNNIRNNMLYFYQAKSLSMLSNTIRNNTESGDYKLYIYISNGGTGVCSCFQSNLIYNKFSSYLIHTQLGASNERISFENCIFQNNTGSYLIYTPSTTGIRYLINCYISHPNYLISGGGAVVTTSECVLTTFEFTKTLALSHYSTYYCPGIDIEQNEVPCQTMPTYVEVIQYPSPTGCIYTHDELNLGMTAVFHILQPSMLALVLMN